MFKAIVAAMALCSIALPAKAELRDYGARSVPDVMSEQQLDRDAREHWKSFTTGKSHFGAFHYNAKTRVSYWVTGLTSLSVAITITKTMCEQASRNKGDCVLVATLVPKGFPKGAQEATGLSRGQSAAVADWKKDRAPGYAAFAVDGLGDHGWSTGHGDKASAIDTAMLYCMSFGGETMAESSGEFRKAYQRHGLTECRLFRVEKR